ncbi:MAG: DUF924 domain-containing protein [Ahrensia sp.]|nr:DUF924 domain-containing protein [Ahrensia sp.]
MNDLPDEILSFWREIGPKKWWRKDAKVDAAIRERFGETHAQARQGKLDDWLDDPQGALALIILLDQFSRNLNRNSALAFAEDTRCAHLVRSVLARKIDEQMPDDLRAFCYLPLMHSEHPVDQQLCLEKMRSFGVEANMKAAREHAQIIERFGRFPHRNSLLGRTTTPEEQAFLDGGGFKG